MQNTKTKAKVCIIRKSWPGDGSVEPKHFSVDFLINLSFHLDYLVINFSTYCRITILYLPLHIYRSTRGQWKRGNLLPKVMGKPTQEISQLEKTRQSVKTHKQNKKVSRLRDIDRDVPRKIQIQEKWVLGKNREGHVNRLGSLFISS